LIVPTWNEAEMKYVHSAHYYSKGTHQTVFPREHTKPYSSTAHPIWRRTRSIA